MEDGLNVQIDLRSDSIQLEGDPADVARVEGIFADFEHLRKLGVHPHNGELNALLKMVVADPAVTLRGLVESGKQRSAGVKRMVQPRSPNQRKYVEAIETNDMVFGLGPAGTGKTYLAVAMAVSALMAKKVSRIILVRPAAMVGPIDRWHPARAFLRVSGTRDRAIPEIDQISKPWMLRHLRNIGSAAQMRTIIFLAA